MKFQFKLNSERITEGNGSAIAAKKSGRKSGQKEIRLLVALFTQKAIKDKKSWRSSQKNSGSNPEKWFSEALSLWKHKVN